MAIYVAPDRINMDINTEFGCFKYGRSFDSGGNVGRYYKVANVTGGANSQFKLDLIGFGAGYGSTDGMAYITIYGEIQNGNSSDNLQLAGYYQNQMRTIYTQYNSTYDFNIYVECPQFGGADILFTSNSASATLPTNDYISGAPTGTVYNKTSKFVAL